MIILENIKLQRGSRPLLTGASARIHPGQKVALIGANGVGKSTLFQLFLGELAVEEGMFSLPRHWRVAHMAQEVSASERRAIDYVMDGDAVLRRLEIALAEAEAQCQNERLATLLEEYETHGGYQARSRAEILLQGLGFRQDQINNRVAEFSGGWRIRLNLAQALMKPSDLLLLDEPTNHLDLDASLWLENWLRQYDGTLILISHDRDFIDSVCDQIMQIEHQRLWLYRGNYSAFERQRAERLAREQANFEKQQRRRAEIEDFVRRFRAKASKARQAQSRIKELQRMEELAPAHVDSPFDFHFPEPDRMSDPLLALASASVGYASDHPVVSGVKLNIHPGSRIGLLGANGAGKSTLMRSLAGDLELLSGEFTRGEHLRIGYFNQHQMDVLDLDATPLLHLQRLTPEASEQALRNFLGSFDFRGDRVNEPIRIFSGGEKARLALASIVWLRPNLLLLDEPTNHLDLEMCHALTLALQGFEGALIVVSHDRHLLRNCVDDLMLVADGRVTAYEGDLDDYGRWLLSTLAEARKMPEGGEKNTDKPDRRAQRKEAAELRRQLSPLKKQLQSIEKSIAEIDKQLLVIQEEIANPAIYDASNREILQGKLVQQGKFQQEKESQEARWLEILEQLESLEAELS